MTPQPAPANLQNEASQLIERVNNLHAHQNERCDHEIKTKMHEGLAPNILAARAVLRRTGNQTQYSLVMTCFDFEPRFDSSSMIFGSLRFRRTAVNLFCNAFGKSSDLSGRFLRGSRNAGKPARGRQRVVPGQMLCQSSEAPRGRRTLRRRFERRGFRRRGRDASLTNRFDLEGFLLRREFLPVHTPWKILIPHSTMTMANTSVATANTLSKEATLILLSASSPGSGLVDSLIPPQSRGHNRLSDTGRLWFAGHTSSQSSEGSR
jgi:hypothetical protein